MGLTGMYNAPVSEEDGIALLKEAFNQGITFFDTADIYGKDFANEYLVGKVRPSESYSCGRGVGECIVPVEYIHK